MWLIFHKILGHGADLFVSATWPKNFASLSSNFDLHRQHSTFEGSFGKHLFDHFYKDSDSDCFGWVLLIIRRP